MNFTKKFVGDIDPEVIGFANSKSKSMANSYSGSGFVSKSLNYKEHFIKIDIINKDIGSILITKEDYNYIFIENDNNGHIYDNFGEIEHNKIFKKDKKINGNYAKIGSIIPHLSPPNNTDAYTILDIENYFEIDGNRFIGIKKDNYNSKIEIFLFDKNLKFKKINTIDSYDSFWTNNINKYVYCGKRLNGTLKEEIHCYFYIDRINENTYTKTVLKMSRSIDGGKNWTNTILNNSDKIGTFIGDPIYIGNGSIIMLAYERTYGNSGVYIYDTNIPNPSIGGVDTYKYKIVYGLNTINGIPFIYRTDNYGDSWYKVYINNIFDFLSNGDMFNISTLDLNYYNSNGNILNSPMLPAVSIEPGQNGDNTVINSSIYYWQNFDSNGFFDTKIENFNFSGSGPITDLSSKNAYNILKLNNPNIQEPIYFNFSELFEWLLSQTEIILNGNNNIAINIHIPNNSTETIAHVPLAKNTLFLSEDNGFNFNKVKIFNERVSIIGCGNKSYAALYKFSGLFGDTIRLYTTNDNFNTLNNKFIPISTLYKDYFNHKYAIKEDRTWYYTTRPRYIFDITNNQYRKCGLRCISKQIIDTTTNKVDLSKLKLSYTIPDSIYYKMYISNNGGTNWDTGRNIFTRKIKDDQPIFIYTDQVHTMNCQQFIILSKEGSIVFPRLYKNDGDPI